VQRSDQSSILLTSPKSDKSRFALDYLRYHLGHWLTIFLLVAGSVIMLAPFAWTFATSLRLPAESFSVPPQWIPVNPNWDNYHQVFVRIPFWSQIFNSIAVTASIVIGQLATASLAAYAFARLTFPGRELLFWVVMATMMIPLQATIIPVFVLISQLGLTDTLTSLILPALPTAFGTFLLRQYFMAISKEFEEAATIDGANPFQVFYRVYLPLVAPGQAVLAVLSFNQHWNEFFRPLVFLLTNSKFTIPLGLNDLKGFESTGSISVVVAGVVISLIPVVFVYFFGQRYLIEGIMMGGVKA